MALGLQHDLARTWISHASFVCSCWAFLFGGTLMGDAVCVRRWTKHGYADYRSWRNLFDIDMLLSYHCGFLHAL